MRRASVRLRVSFVLGVCPPLALTACLPDNPSVEDEAGETDGEDTGETGGEARVEDGPLGCPAGEACTIVAVSQTVDDRVELFTAAGPGPTHRGTLDLDLKPNPGGDISGEPLDEPYGLAWDGASLHLLVGHYPTRELGSLLSFPAASLADYEAGARVDKDDWFADGATFAGVTLTELGRTEPLSLLALGRDLLAVAVFANDLLVPEDQWTEPSQLLVLAPGDAAADQRVLELECDGAWSLTALDGPGEAITRAAAVCDGDEAVAILDLEGVGAEGGAPELVCLGDVAFSNKRMRYAAGDGLGGVLVGEAPTIVSATEDARLWWYDGGCGLRGFTTLSDDLSWRLRELEALPSPAGPRWLLARAAGDDRGVLVMAGDPETGEVTQCGRLDALDEAGAWTAAGGDEPLEPHALAITADGRGVAVGAGPATYPNAGPGWGEVWWVELEAGDDPCTVANTNAVELSAAAPAVDANLPETWRRAPDVVEIIEVEP